MLTAGKIVQNVDLAVVLLNQLAHELPAHVANSAGAQDLPHNESRSRLPAAIYWET